MGVAARRRAVAGRSASLLGVGLVYGPAPLRWLVRVFTDIIRGIPILVLIFFVYYGLPAARAATCQSFWAAVLALTLFKTAQVIEISARRRRLDPARARWRRPRRSA